MLPKAPSNELKSKVFYNYRAWLSYKITKIYNILYLLKEDNKTGKKGIVDENDAVIIPLEYDEITLIGNSKAAVNVKNRLII